MHRNDNGGADGSYVNECECANGYAKSDEMYLADIHGLLRLVNVQIGFGKGESRRIKSPFNGAQIRAFVCFAYCS